MPVVMEVAHQRHMNSRRIEFFADSHDRPRRIGRIHREPHEFAARLGEFGRLSIGRLCICRCRIGHRLHDYRPAAADRNGRRTPNHINRRGPMTVETACIHCWHLVALF